MPTAIHSTIDRNCFEPANDKGSSLCCSRCCTLFGRSLTTGALKVCSNTQSEINPKGMANSSTCGNRCQVRSSFEREMKYCMSGANVPMTRAGQIGLNPRKGSAAAACERVKGIFWRLAGWQYSKRGLAAILPGTDYSHALCR